MTALQPLIGSRILTLREQRVMLDADLADLYGVATRVLRLAELEDKTEALAMNHDTFSRNTRNQLKQVFDARRELMTPPDPPKRPIGFINPEDKGGSKKSSGARGKT